MKIKPNTYFLWNGQLAYIRATSEFPTAHFVMVREEDKDKCKKCGEPYEHERNIIVDSPLWKSNAKPVQTLEGKGEDTQ